jgi:hypothetical protein
MVSERQERNRQTALDFCDLMFNQCRPADAMDGPGRRIRWIRS